MFLTLLLPDAVAVVIDFVDGTGVVGDGGFANASIVVVVAGVGGGEDVVAAVVFDADLFHGFPSSK